MTWYLAQFKPNAHRLACENLERQGFDVFLPLLEETRRTGSRFAQFRVPLFQGYVFVGFDVTHPGWRAISNTRGITRLVKFGEAPVPVPDGLVEALRLRCAADGTLLPERNLKSGDKVRISQGPFAELVGTIETIERSERIQVLLDIIGSETRVTLNKSVLRPA